MGRDKREYFRWNEDICGFMRTHWNKLMPDRKRTQSWRSTVAGTLSVNCPSVFQSGGEILCTYTSSKVNFDILKGFFLQF